MSRIAVVGPSELLRSILVELSEAGVVELETSSEGDSSEMSEALRRLRASGAPEPEPRLAAGAQAAAELEAQHRADLLAGEVELERAAAAALRHGAVVAIVGWSPAAAVVPLADRLAPLGGAVVRLPFPRWPTPPGSGPRTARWRRCPQAVGRRPLRP